MLTVIVERPTGYDPFGNPKPPTTHTVDDCWAYPPGMGATSSAGNEQTHLQSVVEWDLDLYAPAGADIRPEDVVRVPGEFDPDGNLVPFQVHGRANRWRAPTGWSPGDIIRLKAVV
jgi:hypothetical protein